jgi:hypothetical protein
MDVACLTPTSSPKKLHSDRSRRVVDCSVSVAQTAVIDNSKTLNNDAITETLTLSDDSSLLSPSKRFRRRRLSIPSQRPNSPPRSAVGAHPPTAVSLAEYQTTIDCIVGLGFIKGGDVEPTLRATYGDRSVTAAFVGDGRIPSAAHFIATADETVPIGEAAKERKPTEGDCTAPFSRRPHKTGVARGCPFGFALRTKSASASQKTKHGRPFHSPQQRRLRRRRNVPPHFVHHRLHPLGHAPQPRRANVNRRWRGRRRRSTPPSVDDVRDFDCGCRT